MLITIYAACWDLRILLAPGEGYYSSSKHCLHQHLLLKLHLFALAAAYRPFTALYPPLDQQKGTLGFLSKRTIHLAAGPPVVSCSCPAWGGGKLWRQRQSFPGGPCPPAAAVARQCQLPKVSQRRLGHGLSRSQFCIHFLHLLLLCETDVNDFKSLENSDTVALYVPSA